MKKKIHTNGFPVVMLVEKAIHLTITDEDKDWSVGQGEEKETVWKGTVLKYSCDFSGLGNYVDMIDPSVMPEFSLEDINRLVAVGALRVLLREEDQNDSEENPVDKGNVPLSITPEPDPVGEQMEFFGLRRHKVARTSILKEGMKTREVRCPEGKNKPKYQGRLIYEIRSIHKENFHEAVHSLIDQGLLNGCVQIFVDVIGGRSWITVPRWEVEYESK